MIPPEILDKLDNIARQARQSARARNEAELFIRDVAREAKNAHINEVLPQEQIEALAADHWLRNLNRSRAQYPLNVIENAAERRNHKLMLKLLRHPDDTIRSYAADQFQILFAMLDGYYDEASAVVNQTLLIPTEIPEVKYALLRDLGRSSRRGLPREIGDTARRLIHDVDQVVSYHALRLLSTLYDVRDWKAVLDRMISLVGEEDEAAEYFLSAGVDYLQIIIQYQPEVVEWVRSLLDTYGPEHMAVRSLQSFVRRNPDIALEVGLINKREYRELKGA
ncbi:MAG: hypothetical protein IT324_04230 [Anaerolineae bacterium]|nr:hypothetical protein [Anaerolineae bacterium]